MVLLWENLRGRLWRVEKDVLFVWLMRVLPFLQDCGSILLFSALPPFGGADVWNAFEDLGFLEYFEFVLV